MLEGEYSSSKFIEKNQERLCLTSILGFQGKRNYGKWQIIEYRTTGGKNFEINLGTF